MNDFRRPSDKRPLTSSTASTLVYETVPGQQDPNQCKESTKPRDRENIEEHNYVQETLNKQQSTEAIPVYEIQYEPVKIDKGLSVIEEEGEDLNDTKQRKLRETGGSNGTMSSHHSYEIIKDREDAILEASTESSLDNKQERDMDNGQLQQGGGGTTTNRGAAAVKKGAKNVMYENITIAMSPDVRY